MTESSVREVPQLRYFEVQLKKPICLEIIPGQPMEITQINPGVETAGGGSIIFNDPTGFLKIEHYWRVFLTQHGWVDLRSTSLQFPTLIIPISNIAGLIQSKESTPPSAA